MVVFFFGQDLEKQIDKTLLRKKTEISNWLRDGKFGSAGSPSMRTGLLRVYFTHSVDSSAMMWKLKLVGRLLSSVQEQSMRSAPLSRYFTKVVVYIDGEEKPIEWLTDKYADDHIYSIEVRESEFFALDEHSQKLTAYFFLWNRSQDHGEESLLK